MNPLTAFSDYMGLDLPYVYLLEFVTRLLLADLLTLLSYLSVGLLIGVVLAYLIRRFIKGKAWFNRPRKSLLQKLFYYTLRVWFYLAIIAIPSIVSVIIGTNKIVETEVNSAINESLSYCQENYFQDYELIEETFEIGMEVYQSGETVNNLNHHLADGMVQAISAEYGLGFLGQYLLRNSKKEMIEQLEGIEKAFLFLIVSKGLEQLDLDGTIDEDQLDKAFYTWLHSDGENDYDNLNSWLSHQVSSVTRPFIFSLYLPFLIVSLVIVLINVLEAIYFFKFSAHARQQT